MANLSHAALTQTTITTTNVFGTQREVPNGKKWIYPENYDNNVVLITGSNNLTPGKVFKAKVLLEGSKFHTLESGNLREVHWYRIIEVAK